MTYPETVQAFSQKGWRCPQCAAIRVESIAEGAKLHPYSLADALECVNALDLKKRPLPTE